MCVCLCVCVCGGGGGGHCGVVVSALDVRSEGHFFEAHGPCHRVVFLRQDTLPYIFFLHPGARFSKVPVTFRARSYILKSESLKRCRSF